MSQPPYPPPQGQPVPDPQNGSYQPYAQGPNYPPPQAGAQYGQGSYLPFGQEAPPPAKPPAYKRPWFVVLATLLVVGVIGAIAQGADDESASEAASTSSQSESPAPQTQAAPPPTTQAVAPPPPAPATEPQPVEPVGVNFTMPDFVGLDLQSAQDLVQTYGVFLSRSHDLRGSRMQVLDSNWIVCDQNIPVGQQVTGDVEGQIDFGVVKREESCP